MAQPVMARVFVFMIDPLAQVERQRLWQLGAGAMEDTRPQRRGHKPQALAPRHQLRQLLRQQFAVERAVDAFAGLVVVVVHQVVRVAHGNADHGQAQAHRGGEDADDDPGPEVLVPGAGGGGGRHCALSLLADLWADETALGFNLGVTVVGALEDEGDFVGGRWQFLWGNRQLHGKADDVTGGHADLALAFELEVWQAGGIAGTRARLGSAAPDRAAADSSASSVVIGRRMPTKRCASIDLPEPGGPTMSKEWPPAAAISSTRLTPAWPFTSARSA